MAKKNVFAQKYDEIRRLDGTQLLLCREEGLQEKKDTSAVVQGGGAVGGQYTSAVVQGGGAVGGQYTSAVVQGEGL